MSSLEVSVCDQWDEFMCASGPLVAKMFQGAMVIANENQETESIEDNQNLREAETKLLKLADNPTVVDDIQALFEESHQKRENISHFPMEDTCWCIGDWEHLLGTDGKILRLMAVLDLSTSQPATRMISLAYKSDTSYEEQAMPLFCHACFHPARKCQRRPHFVKLLDTPGARGVVLDLVHFGVSCFDSESSTHLEWKNTLIKENPIMFRRCFNCGLRGTPDMFVPCSQCKAVMYCDHECQTDSWKSRHKAWCKKFRTYMKMEHQLAELPFTFSQISTSQNFTGQKFKSFLQENDVYNKGLWRRECPSEADGGVAFGELLSPHKPYVLPLENTVLESALLDKEPTSLDRPLQDWTDYYNYRGFWFDSPIAGLLHYPLTLYWIVVHWLPQHYLAVFRKMKLSSSLQVHIIGAEKEAEMFDPFLECARLLAPVNLHIHLFGDEISKSVHDKCQKTENLTFHIHCGLYHKSTLHELPVPDLVVGFNAGLSAYSSFIKTVSLLLEKKTPLFCTDYCYYSIVHSQKALYKSHMGRMLNPVINPFRSPFRLVAEEVNFPRYSNAFVYCVKPWKPKKDSNNDGSTMSE